MSQEGAGDLRLANHPGVSLDIKKLSQTVGS